jgi:dTMP kinase
VEPVAALEKIVLGALRPDLVVVLDIDPEEGLRRAKHRGDENRFEAETLAFMRRVRQAYLDRIGTDPQRYALVDASRPAEDVQAQIEAILERHL